MKIGKRLKQVRKEKKMTLKELSEKSGVQIATLSRMEHNVMPGTLKSHIAICKVLKISLADFYREVEDENKTVSVTKQHISDRPFVRSDSFAIEMLTDKISGRHMMPVLNRIRKNGEMKGNERRIGVEKFIYVLEGKIEAKIGKEKYNLKRGDSVYFDASLDHAFSNTAKIDTLVLTVSSPPAA